MHLSVDDQIKASKIAARRFFSTDQAVGADDLESVALLRIVERNPTTIGTAVFVGREGIAREIQYNRYKNAGNTVQISCIESDEQPLDYLNLEKPERPDASVVAQKYERFVNNLCDQMGPPVELFGRFGLAYDRENISEKLIRRFRVCDRIDSRNRWIFFSAEVKPRHRTLAADQYVLTVLSEKRAQTQLAF